MEFMSNLGGGAQADRPSLFELIAQDKMREMLEPALRYVIAVKSLHSKLRKTYHTMDTLEPRDSLLTLFVSTFSCCEWAVRSMRKDTPDT
jgi:hypothetical protein